jgi:hypothetical protein
MRWTPDDQAPMRQSALGMKHRSADVEGGNSNIRRPFFQGEKASEKAA